MLRRLIPPQIHGWLDDAVVLTYLIGAFILKLGGTAMTIALGGALVHFILSRFTHYPQGYVKLIPFRVHAFIELAEGLAVLGCAWSLLDRSHMGPIVFFTFLGLSQVVAFLFSDYRWPLPERGDAAA